MVRKVMYYNLVRTHTGHIAPYLYLHTPRRILNEFVNGCGTQGFGDKLVPDVWLGIGFRESCRVHDLMYFLGQTIKDKKIADTIFYVNLRYDVLRQTGNWFKRMIGYGICYGYYQAVSIFGKKAFEARDIKYVRDAAPYYEKYHTRSVDEGLHYSALEV